MKTSLYYREGSSDKVYHVEMTPVGGLFLVNFTFGRRGSALSTGTKTPSPVDEPKARSLFDKLVREKKAKGYTEGEAGTPYQHSDDAGRVSGHLPQLLNAIDEKDLPHFLEHPDWCLQEKKDGRRLLVEKNAAQIRGMNRRGLIVGLPEPLVSELASFKEDFVLDGEIVDETFHAFDLLKCEGQSWLPQSCLDRLRRLDLLLARRGLPRIEKIETACGPENKQRRFRQLQQANAEGAVFKLLTADYRAGRPASGGPALKYKFCADAACVVLAVNPDRRSVALCVYDGEQRVQVGNVTIPPNQPVPRPNDIVQVRYLYAIPQSRALFQPVFQWRRDDLEPAECTLQDLKFKRSVEEEE